MAAAVQRPSLYTAFLKPALDRVCALLLTAALSPLLALIALAVRLDSPGPVLFGQKRVGRNGAYFTIYKFRTMRHDTPGDVPTHLLANPNSYITRMGRLLRKTSLDELPQLFNIIRGDMSFVGPRPALWNQDDLLALRRENGSDGVRPGITGLAQIRGRDELPIPRKAAYDGEYARQMNLFRDLAILIKTLGYVLASRGIREGGEQN